MKWKNVKTYRERVKALIQPVLYEDPRNLVGPSSPIGTSVEVYEEDLAKIKGVWPETVEDERTKQLLNAYILGVYSLDREKVTPIFGYYTTKPDEEITILVSEGRVEVYANLESPTLIRKSGDEPQIVIPGFVKPYNVMVELKPGECINFRTPSLYRLSERMVIETDRNFPLEYRADKKPPLVYSSWDDIWGIRVCAQKLREYKEELYQ